MGLHEAMTKWKAIKHLIKEKYKKGDIVDTPLGIRIVKAVHLHRYKGDEFQGVEAWETVYCCVPTIKNGTEPDKRAWKGRHKTDYELSESTIYEQIGEWKEK